MYILFHIYILLCERFSVGLCMYVGHKIIKSIECFSAFSMNNIKN